jgi:hypothetical protein
VWGQAVGVRIARHSQPKRFKDGTLWIAVDNAAWMQQLSLLSEDIRGKVNQGLESPLVEKLRFQIGEVKSRSGSKLTGEDGPPERAQADLDPPTKQAIKKVTETLPDKELKERLKSLFEKSSRFHRDFDKE